MCFGFTYMSTLLTNGFGFADDVLFKVNSTYSWTLGAMAWESRLTQFYGPVIEKQQLWSQQTGKILVYVGAPMLFIALLVVIISASITIRQYCHIKSGYERI